MKKLIYTKSDGSVCIVVPASKESIEKLLGSLTDEEYEKHVIDRSIPEDAINMSYIDDEHIPQDREFRNAWKQSGNQINFNLDKAKDIQLSRIRFVRDAKLKDLDTEYMIALDKGIETKNISAQKQVLRDITEPLKAMVPNNLDEIKAAFPQSLRE